MTASPASRSERGRKLQKRLGVDARGARGSAACVREGAVRMASPSGDRQAEVAVDLVGQVHDELPVVGARRTAGTRRAAWARGRTTLRAVARVLRAVAGTEEAVGQPQRRRRPRPAVCGLRQRLGAHRAAQVRAHRRDRVEGVALAEHEQPLVGQELEAVREVGGRPELAPWWARRRTRWAPASAARRRPAPSSAATPAPVPSLSRKSRRSVRLLRRGCAVDSWAPSLRDAEALHRHGVGGAADGAQPAADAAVVVLDHRRQREAVGLGPRRRASARSARARSSVSNGTIARQYSGQMSTQRLHSTHFSGS